MTDASRLLKDTRRETGPALAVTLVTTLVHALLAVPVALILAGLVDHVVFRGAGLADVTSSLALLVGLALARAGLAWIAERSGARAAGRVRLALFRQLLAHVRGLGPFGLVGVPTGEVVAILTDAIAATDPYWRRWMPAAATAAVMPIVLLLVVAPLDWWSGLVLVVTLPLLPVFMVLAGRGAEKANQERWGRLVRLGGHLLDTVQGLVDLQIFRAARREVAVVRAMADAFRRDTMAVLRLAFLSALVLEFFATVSIALVAVLVGFRLMWGDLDFATGFAVLLLTPEFFAPLRRMGSERHARMEAVAAAERLVGLLARPARLAPGGTAPAPAGAAVALRFDGVTVDHGSGRPALDRLDLTIAAGEHVAVVGPSGAGKSTLFALLLGFVAPSAGRVLVDDHPLAQIDQTEWRRRLVHVAQRPHLFDDDVTGNVVLGRADPGEDVAAAVAAALEAAEASEVVARLPQGAATRLGENGFGLSGGEAQRIALARAFFRPGALVLFDEPTAHLDPATEALVGRAIDALARGRTRLTIAHRLTTVARADRIVVLDGGRIVEEGGHADLLARGGLYARMVGADRGPTEGRP